MRNVVRVNILQLALRFSLVPLLLLITPASYGQTSKEGLSDHRVRNLKVRERNLDLALSKIARRLNVPVGLEIDPGDDTSYEAKISFQFEDAALKDVLDTLVKQEPRYAWRVIDGVINVYPKQGHGGLTEEILETRVQRFQILEGTTLFSIRRSIVELPEVKNKLEAAHISPAIMAFSGIDYAGAGGGFSLNSADLTVREILNQIIKSSSVKYWVISRYGDKNEFILLNFG